MIERALAYVDEVERQGGIVAATESGWVHADLARSAYDHQMRVKDGRVRVVGVNCFVEPEAPPREIFAQPPAALRQSERLRAWRLSRDGDAVKRALDRMEEGLRAGDNAFPRVLAAVEAGATLGDVHKRFREALGTWTMPLFRG